VTAALDCGIVCDKGVRPVPDLPHPSNPEVRTVATSPVSSPTILLPLDGSDLSERAVGLAVTIARRLNGRLLVLTVPEVYGLNMGWYGAPSADGNAPAIPVDDWLGEARAAAERYLAARASLLRAEGVRVETRLVEDTPPHAILDTAAAEGAWLIVMGTHGYGGVSRWAFGSVAEKVLHASETPLLFVRAGAGHVDLKLDNIMVALDGSAASESTLAAVQALALTGPTRVTLCSVIIEPLMTAPNAALLDARKHYQDHMEGYLVRVVERLRGAGIDADYELLSDPDPAAALVARQGHVDVDLIAVGSHGQGGRGRWSLGSVASRVIRAADSPVLVVRSV
jgi:nucleotide-binding universal stress UspA family protein